MAAGCDNTGVDADGDTGCLLMGSCFANNCQVSCSVRGVETLCACSLDGLEGATYSLDALPWCGSKDVATACGCPWQGDCLN